MESSGDDSIRVFVRVRPPDPNLDRELDHTHCVDVTSTTSLSVSSRPEPKVFTFDHVAGMNTTQEDVFSAIGRPIIESCVCGYNGTIFAYGQTGSGKTFTMIGPTQEDSDSFTHELRGIIPRGFEYLFSLINREKEKYGELVEFLCKCSFLEIYNEQVFDLLDPASCGLHLRENMSRGVYVDGLTEQSISSARDAYQVLRTGWVNRRVASTSMNRESSRSHAVFTLTIESKKREVKESVAKIKTSLLNLVDLAGSERQRDTQTAGLRLKEAGSINKSLSALGNVIMALVDIAHGKSRHVHYRDSKLTFLLRDSLGGNAKTHLVANVHPSARCFGETLSTLNFARRAKMIRNKAVVNEDTSGTVQQLQCEIKRLKQLVEKLRSGMAVAIPLPPTPEERGSTMLPGSSSPSLSTCSSSSSSSSPSSSLIATTSSSGVAVLSDDAKTIRELKEMLTHSMAAREKTESTKTSLLERIDSLQKLCDKKDKFLQSTKMILKFRETHIGNMERGKKGRGGGGVMNGESARGGGGTGRTGGDLNGVVLDESLANIVMLKQEVDQLKYQVEHHPDVTKFALENLDLRAELKKLRAAEGGSGGSTIHKELARTHQYTLQLERQLRHFLAKEAGGCNERVGSPVKVGGVTGLTPTPRLRPQVSTMMEETGQSSQRRLEMRCGQLQSELEKMRRQLVTEREEFHLKEAQMEASLHTSHKANQELERSLEALKLKNSVEKATLNDLHMNTIRSMLTPKRAAAVQLSKSITAGTPMRRADSDPVKQSLDFTPKKDSLKIFSTLPLSPPPPSIPESPEMVRKGGVSSPVSSTYQTGTSSRHVVSVGTNTDISGDLPVIEGGFNELNIEGALTDELKLLQDANRHLHSQIEELETTVFHLDRDKSDLTSQLEQLQTVSRSDLEASLLREQDLLEKVAAMTSTIADFTSSNTVLKSEVIDLRVCLKSADKELKEIKTARKLDVQKHNTKLMESMQKIGELEQEVATKVADLERQTEDLQNIQDEVETAREELTFKSHQINDLELALRREKEHSTSLSTDMQSILEKLAREVEKNTQLSSELQEGENGKQQELVKALDENALLLTRVTELEGDMKRQLQDHQKQTTDAQTTISSLHNRQMADREAIGSLMSQLQDVRASSATEDARINSLKRELQDTSRELGESLSRNNRQATQLESLQARIKTLALDHERDLKKKDSEREIVVEELEHISEEHQQLSATFAAQSAELAQVEREAQEMRGRLALRETELARLRQKKERRASVSKAQSFEEMKTLVQQTDEEKDRLRSELNKAVAMLGDYEQTREEKEKEIKRLQEEMRLRDGLAIELSSLKDSLASVQSLLEEQQNKEVELRQKMEDQRAERQKLQADYFTAVETRDRALKERVSLQKALEDERSAASSLADQLSRYKAIEQRLFDEKQSYQSQLEALMEEKSKLAKECAELSKENAAISGHRNLRQKIHYHATTKLENSRLKEEVMTLENRLRVKTAELANLQKKVTYLLTEPPTTGHTPSPSSSHSFTSTTSTTPSRGPNHHHQLNNSSLLKENIIPK